MFCDRRPGLPGSILICNLAISCHKHSERIADKIFMELERKEDRSLCAELMQIQWKDDEGVEHTEFVTLEDISRTGLCLGTDVSLSPETRVVVKYPGGKYQGRVRYCRSDPLGYQVGIEFDPGYAWSPRQFRPSHLTQFRLRAVKPPEPR
jgi:hypothetical protein